MALSLPAWRSTLSDYPAESHFVNVDGLQMHYVDEGDRSAPVVLMVHGNPTWSWYWRHLITGVTPMRRAIAVDHIGCGLSEKPPRTLTLDDRIAHLRQLVTALDLSRITLVVHDWGGAIGLGAALADLDRYEKFVLLNTAAFPPPFFPWRIRACRMPVFGKLAVQGGNVFARAAVRMATTQSGGLPAAVAEGLLRPYDRWDHRRAIYDFVADIPTRPAQPTMQRLMAIEQSLPRLQQSNRPVLLLWGMRDWCFRPECLRRFQQILPHAETREYAAAGHYVMEDAREEIVQEIRTFTGIE